MMTLQFADTHNMVAFLSKPAESDGFEQIVDFLNAHLIRYALTVNPTIYISFIEQLWSTAMAKTINREAQLHAKVDGKKIIVTESFVRRDLRLADEEGIDCLPNFTIFEQIALMGKPTRKDTHVPQPSGPTASVLDKATYKELGDSLVRAATIDSSLEIEHDNGSLKLDELMALCTTLQNKILDLEKTTTTQRNKIASLKRRVKKLEKKNRSRTHRLKRLYKVGLTARVESSGDEKSLGEDVSKQVKRIDAIDADEEITLVSVQDEVVSNDANKEMFDVDVLGGEEMFVAWQNENVDKGKRIMLEEPVKPKKKDQIRLDEEAAKKLQVEFDEEERLARERVEKKRKSCYALIEEWDDIQAKTDADHQLAKRLQAKEKEELLISVKLYIFKTLKYRLKQPKTYPKCNTIELGGVKDASQLFIAKKATLFQQLLEKIRKHFAAKRAEEERNKPPTKAQHRKIMCTYLKNMEGYKLKDLKLKEFDSIQEMFDKAFKRVNTFEDFKTELVKGKEKRAGEELKLIPLAVKSPKIVDWKIHKEGKKCYYQIVRADGKSRMYMIFSQMLKSFNREDLEDLYKLVKARYGSIRPVESIEYLLWSDMQIMFEPHVEDELLMKKLDGFEEEYQVLGRIIKSLLDVVGITDAEVYVYTALMKLEDVLSWLLVERKCDVIAVIRNATALFKLEVGKQFMEEMVVRELLEAYTVGNEKVHHKTVNVVEKGSTIKQMMMNVVDS
uniref:Xylulose kinase-1 n=1 Tax=Tanacetum cinerariifolium TaxID=118510 RepID=A0A6L2JHH1_TANCI|nr:hypothetical protein [Tanacetum cinerariifolium]